MLTFYEFAIANKLRCESPLGFNHKLPSTVVHIVATDIESRIFERLKNKQSLQGILLDILGEQSHG